MPLGGGYVKMGADAERHASHRIDQQVGSLFGGQRQVAIAVRMVCMRGT